MTGKQLVEQEFDALLPTHATFEEAWADLEEQMHMAKCAVKHEQWAFLVCGYFFDKHGSPRETVYRSLERRSRH